MERQNDMSTILAVVKVRQATAWWLILDCGHWYKWTGEKPLKVNGEIRCPNCTPLPTVVSE